MMIRKFLPLALAALLAACWQSDVPLIPDNEVDSPKIAGKYKLESTDSDGEVTVADILLKKGDGGGFIYQAGMTTSSPTQRLLRLDHLQGDWYLVQSQSLQVDGTYEKPYYRLLKVGKKVLEEYDPSCGIADESFGQVSVSSTNCTFMTYQGLKATALKRLEENASGNASALTLASTYTR